MMVEKVQTILFIYIFATIFFAIGMVVFKYSQLSHVFHKLYVDKSLNLKKLSNPKGKNTMSKQKHIDMSNTILGKASLQLQEFQKLSNKNLAKEDNLDSLANSSIICDITQIKKQIYDLSIEYVDEVSLLYDLVQQNRTHSKYLWQDSTWISADDWKRNLDGLKLMYEQKGYHIYDDRASSNEYIYDEVNDDFTYEKQYFGKKIVSKVKFINDNLLVKMKISGIKVFLDLYQRE